MTTPTPDSAASATPVIAQVSEKIDPVAWRVRAIGWGEPGPWCTIPDLMLSSYRLRPDSYEIEPLYSAATVAALEAEVERLRDSLDALIQAASPMVTDDIQHERVIEKGSRGHTSISIDPFPLMKFRHEDMRDLKSELERARKALTGAGAK